MKNSPSPGQLVILIDVVPMPLAPVGLGDKSPGIFLSNEVAVVLGIDYIGHFSSATVELFTSSDLRGKISAIFLKLLW